MFTSFKMLNSTSRLLATPVRPNNGFKIFNNLTNLPYPAQFTSQKKKSLSQHHFSPTFVDKKPYQIQFIKGSTKSNTFDFFDKLV